MTGENDEVPRGWNASTLGDVCESMKNGIYRPSSVYSDDGIACLRMYNISNGRIVWRDVKRMRLTKREIKDYELLAGDLLINRVNSRELVGKSAVVPLGLERCVFESKNIRVRVKRHIVAPQFVNYRMLLSGHRYFTRNAQQVVGMASISQPQVAQFPLAFPSIGEQQRIVSEIERQFTRADAAIFGLQRAYNNLTRFRGTTLKMAVETAGIGSPASNWRPLSEAIQSIDQGWSPRCESECSDGETWAVIKTTAIQHLRFEDAENKALPADLKPRPQLQLVEGDLLVTRAGPRSRVGVACLVKSTRARLMLCDKAYRLRLRASKADGRFVELVLNAPQLRDSIDELKTGISDSGVNLTQQRFLGLLVPLPSLIEQRRIVAEVERRLSVVKELEHVVETNLQRAKALCQSILRHAFSGNL